MGSLLIESVWGWSIFALVLLAILVFCWTYIRRYQSQQESEVVSTITAICALAVALITSSLLPVDIFLVSYMKDSRGSYKEWAADNITRQNIEDTVLYGYYSRGAYPGCNSALKTMKICVTMHRMRSDDATGQT
ncbi:hypothetical protein chiPu_0009245 [Chiloscyllium punctatum]|uniref:Uncharacterized protein n=1 Tax=Chiloscyllium punctatum TaxID=137246 RepID=A0A401SK81_CHIPU|nr:hypothetical protein [Chiloscyllium punctatum]